MVFLGYLAVALVSFWTLFLFTGFSMIRAEACPDRCECSAFNCSYGNGTLVNCAWRRLLTFPASIPNDSCALAMHENRITRVSSGALEGLTQLEILYLNDNQIDRIDDNAFAGFTQLRILVLSYNKLLELPEFFLSEIPDLKELFLFSNQIEKINRHTFEGLTNLQTLALARNSITGLVKEIFTPLYSLQNLYIEENPFNCTCDLEEFAVFMQTSGWLPYNSSSVFEPECASPGQYIGVHIIDVPYHNMSCNGSIGKYIKEDFKMLHTHIIVYM
ncbi:uncharacterized protein LOC111137018 [Crassostrea virginica]